MRIGPNSTSLELLDLIIDRIGRLPVLLVVTFRPEFSPPWVGQAQVAALALSRLGAGDAARLVDAVGGGRSFPPEVLDHIVRRTDGIPLFVEELTKTVIESGVLREADGRWIVDRPFLELAVPSSLHDSLMARLDRLAPIKEVAQTGAVIGREFSYELLAPLLSRSEGELQAALDRLVRSELVFRRGTPPAATYIFKHALIQDAAYSSLLRSRRRELHARIAELLQNRMPERTETEPELLAHHYTEAGLAVQAIDYWLRAGRRSAERSANIEAIGHLNRGLEVLRTLPETIERARQELALQVALTGPLVASKGYAATEAAAAAIRARELCERVGDVDRLPQVLYAEVGMLYVAAEDFRRVWPVVERFATVTEGLLDTGAHLVGRRFVALRHFHRGEFRQVRDQVRGTLELFDPIRHDAIAFQYGHDEVVIERAYLSWVLWLLGFPDQAVEWGRAAAARGSEIKHTNSKAIALCWGLAMPQQFLRNPVAVREYSLSVLEYSNEMKLPLWHALGEILAGWSRVELERAKDGLVQMHNGFAEFRATRSGHHLPYHLGRLAEAQRRLGKIEEGRQTIERALALVDRSADQSWESDLHRLNGDLLLSLSRREEAEQSLASAITIAKEQEAKSLELRASLSLARLWCEERKYAQARALLQPVYDWFTEGFDTPDLRDARTLLQQMC